MRRPARRFRAWFALGAVLGLLLGVAWWLRHPSFRMPDGSRVTVVREAFADGFQHAWTPPLWQGWIRPLVPPGSRWARFVDFKSGGLVSCSPDGHPTWFVVTVRTGIPLSGAAPLERVWIPDGDGDPHGFEAVSDAVSLSRPGEACQVWRFRAFPRRAGTVPVRWVWRGADGRYEAGPRMRLRNPAPGRHPEWRPSALPVEASAGDVRGVLRDFVTGVDREREPGGTPDDFWTDRRTTRAVLRVFPEDEGEVRSLEISDASGNRWRPDLESPGVRAEATERVLEFIGALWPGESAWKLRVEWARTRRFPDGNATILELAVPARAAWEESGRGVRLGSVGVRVVGMGGDQAQVPEPFAGLVRGSGIQLALRVEGQPGDRRVVIAGAEDDRGRPVAVEEGVPGQADGLLFTLVPAEGARVLKVRLALSESRFLEFIAAPRRPSP